MKATLWGKGSEFGHVEHTVAWVEIVVAVAVVVELVVVAKVAVMVKVVEVVIAQRST